MKLTHEQRARLRRLSDEHRIAFTYASTPKLRLGLLEKLRVKQATGNSKSACESRAARASGNELMTSDAEEALAAYNRSISLAPWDSEELPLSLANRAAALVGLRRHEAALRDLDRALAAGYPLSKRRKLDERRKRCQRALDRSALANAAITPDYTEPCADPTETLPVTRKQLPTITTPVWAGIPSLSSAVAVRYSPEKQRFLQATAHINPGDVLIVEKPLVSVIAEGNFRTHCYHCLKRCLNMVPCQRCSTAMFCTEECRGEAWFSFHRYECPAMPLLYDGPSASGEPPRGLLQRLSLPLRLLLKTSTARGGVRVLRSEILALEAEKHTGGEMTRIFDSLGRYYPSDLRSMHYLSRFPLRETENEDFHVITLAIVTLLDVLEEDTDFFTCDINGTLKRFFGGLLLRYAAIALDGCTQVAQYNGAGFDAVGVAVYAVTSLANHSCDPNAWMANCHGDIAVVRALKPIAPGEEILLAYCGPYTESPRLVRQQGLVAFRFVCSCVACVADWPKYEWKTPWAPITFKCLACGYRLEASIEVIYFVCPQCNHANDFAAVVDQAMTLNGCSIDKIASVLNMLHRAMVYPNDLFVIAMMMLKLTAQKRCNCADDCW